MIDPTRVYTVNQTWQATGMPQRGIREALERGELRAVRRGRRWLIPGHAIETWIRSLGEVADPQQTNDPRMGRGPSEDRK